MPMVGEGRRKGSDHEGRLLAPWGSWRWSTRQTLARKDGTERKAGLARDRTTAALSGALTGHRCGFISTIGGAREAGTKLSQ